MAKLSHYDERGASRMVDVSTKEPTLRTAKASGLVRMKPETLQLILDRGAAKGDVLETARLAAIMGAKRTGDLIPLCHPLGLDSVEVELIARPPDAVEITATVKFHGRTGVEMEAMTAVSVAGLTIYDMCKAVDRGLVIERVRLEEKSGGVRGPYHRGASDGIETT